MQSGAFDANRVLTMKRVPSAETSKGGPGRVATLT
jgi:hypothetical protein